VTTPAYAETRVPVAQSRRDIEGLLEKRGVRDYRVTTSGALFALDFNWPLRETCTFRSDSYCTRHHSWHKAADAPLRTILGVRIVSPWPENDEKERRRMARVLYWHLKAKLEAVESGLLSFEEEFLPHLTLGRAGPRVWDDAKPAIEAAIENGRDLSHDLMGTSKRALELGDGKGL
jgi:hypothetical protein